MIFFSIRMPAANIMSTDTDTPAPAAAATSSLAVAVKRKQLAPVCDSESSDFEAIKRAKTMQAQEESELSATTPTPQQVYTNVSSVYGRP